MDITSYSFNQHLNADWRQWVKTNLERGVPTKTIAMTLIEKGQMAAATALLKDFKIKIVLPHIDLAKNTVELSDKVVDVVFTCQMPYVVVLDNFMSAEECQQLIAVSEDKFVDARVIDPETGDFVQHPERTSMNTEFQKGENAIISLVENRIAELLHWPVENGEGTQVLRYRDGGEYKAHYDFFDTSTKGGLKAIANSGQRVGTFLMYLSDVKAGGATRFPNMNFEVRPKVGTALYFGNLLMNGLPDQKTLHASVPVTEGTKYIATKWLRENLF